MSSDDYFVEGSISWPRRAIENALLFTPSQRAEIEQFGVHRLSIKMLEAFALPEIRELLSPQPRMSDIRADLVKAERAILAAQTSINRLIGEPRSPPHLMAASRAVFRAEMDHEYGGFLMKTAAKSLTPAAEIMALALANLPKRPTRHRRASAFPIRVIDEALTRGAMYAELPPSPIKGGPPGLVTYTPNIPPSSSPTSPFRRLVGICYERAGVGATDPERAIKEYIKRYCGVPELLPVQPDGTERPSEN